MAGILKNHHGKYLLTLLFASILFASVEVSTQAYAMGQAPSTCPNRYDGPITSAKIIAGGKTYDPIANPGLTFELPNNQQYTVTFTIHTQATSSQNNTDFGSTWYDDDIFRYGNGHCIDNPVATSINTIQPTNTIGPNQDVTITTVAGAQSYFTLGLVPFDFNTLVSGFNYNVNWVPAYNPLIDSPKNLSATTVSSSQINLNWTASSDPANLALQYAIERSVDGGSSWNNISRTGSTTYSDSFLTNGTTYEYRVLAMSSVGASSPSNIASATTLP